jgi:malonyl-CoA decarboxylase
VDRPLDPLARFHLGNALLERINWLGNQSSKGLAESAGFMVNYLYDLSRIERNHEIYAQTGRVLASRDVRRLLSAGHGTGR